MGYLDVSKHLNSFSSNEDGRKVYDYVFKKLDKGESVTVSFSGINGLTTSFVNSAFIELLESFPVDHIKKNLKFVNTTPQINGIINKRFRFEVERKKEAV